MGRCMGIAIGPLHVRRSILIGAPPERVWREFETFDRLAEWFGTGHTMHVFELRIGGRVDLSVVLDANGEHASVGVDRHYGGRVVVFEPQREITFEANWFDDDMQWPVPTFMTLRLTALYDATHVEIFHHGFERLGPDAADNLEGYEQGWDVHHLTRLRAIVGK
jgi:uncharacterized protein YndB with AHSA1/START domain